MRFYPHQHAYYCGVDLHARSMFVHVLDQHGQHLFEKDLPACPDAEAARTPSQALTGTMRRRGSRSDPTGVSIPLRRRLPWPVTPRGDRSRPLDETAYGTERFLGRDLRQGRRPLTRHGSSGPDPV